MLFFRSEEAIDLWCSSRDLPRGPSTDLSRLWRLADAWYGDRLISPARRRTPAEIGAFLEEVGLTDPAWHPEIESG